MPVVFECTASVTVHALLAGMVPPVRTSEVALATIGTDVNPVQPAGVTAIGVPVARSSGGKLSVRPGLPSVAATEFGLVMTSVIVESAPGATAVGLNDFVTVTVVESVALPATVLVMFCVLVSAATGIVFV